MTEEIEEHILEKAVAGIEASDRKKTIRVVAAIVVSAVVFMVLQTLLILIAAGITSKSQQDLADRVDRNLAFTVCILAVHPDVRDDDDILRCFNYADALYPDLLPPLPSPALTPTPK